MNAHSPIHSTDKDLEEMRAFIERADELDTFQRHVHTVLSVIRLHGLLEQQDGKCSDQYGHELGERLLDLLSDLSDSTGELVLTQDDANSALQRLIQH